MIGLRGIQKVPDQQGAHASRPIAVQEAHLRSVHGTHISAKTPRRWWGQGSAGASLNSARRVTSAFSSLVHSTHLYGRRLVLEWAQGEGSLEELRDKTKRHSGDGAGIGKTASKRQARLNMDKKRKVND